MRCYFVKTIRLLQAAAPWVETRGMSGTPLRACPEALEGAERGQGWRLRPRAGDRRHAHFAIEADVGAREVPGQPGIGRRQVRRRDLVLNVAKLEDHTN